MVFKPREIFTANSKVETIHLASVVCGSKINVLKMIPLIKSAILMSQSNLTFHLFVEDETKEELQKTVKITSLQTIRLINLNSILDIFSLVS